MDPNRPITHQDAIELESVALKFAYLAVRAEIAAEQNDESLAAAPITVEDLKQDVDLRRLHSNVHESAQEIPVFEEEEDFELEGLEHIDLLVQKERPEGMQPFSESDVKRFQKDILKLYDKDTSIKMILRQLRHMGHLNDHRKLESEQYQAGKET